MGYFLWLLVAISAGWTVYAVKKWSWDKGEAFGGSILVGIVCGFALAIGTAIFTPMAETETVFSDIQIRSSKPTQGIDGRFHLGTGSISTVDYYYVLLVNADGSFRKWKVPSADTKVYESEVTPHLVSIECRRFGKYTEALWHPIGVRECSTYKYQLYVPPGTVIENYTLM